MSPAHSSRPTRRPQLPAFCNGGGRPPRHTTVSRTSLRSLHRLVLFSLLGQIVVISLLIRHDGSCKRLREPVPTSLEGVRLGFPLKSAHAGRVQEREATSTPHAPHADGRSHELAGNGEMP